MSSRRLASGLVLALTCAVAAPATAGAATYRFKVEKFTLRQFVTWQYVFRDRHCESQTALDYYEHTGEGQGLLAAAPLRQGRVTFRTQRGSFMSGRIVGKPYEDATNPAIGSPVVFGNQAVFNVRFLDDPAEDCVPPEQLGPPPRPTCYGGEDLSLGILQANLLVQRGRLRLSGGVYPDDPERTCADPSAITGAVSHAVPARRNVDALIRDRTVKRIALSAAKKGRLTPRELATPGASFDVLGGKGANYDARWSIVLVRLPSR